MASVLFAYAGGTALAANTVVFYDKNSVSQTHCDNMVVWSGKEDAGATATADGVELTTGAFGGASFWFPSQFDEKKADWTGMKYVEVSVKNLSPSGCNLGIFVTESESLSDDFIEHYTMKKDAVAYMQDAKGDMRKVVSGGGSVYLTSGFEGKIYVPLDENQLQTESWATVDGVFNIKKISSISFCLNDPKSKVLISTVVKTDLDPSALVKETTPPPTTTTAPPQSNVVVEPDDPVEPATEPADGASSTAATAAEGSGGEASSEAAGSDAQQADAPGASSSWILWVCIAVGVVLAAGAVAAVVIVKRRGTKQP